MSTAPDPRRTVITLAHADSGRNNVQTWWILSDIHYLSPSLYRMDEGSFSALSARSTGRLFEAMPEVMNEFRRKALRLRPHRILIPGDITLNGEAQSLFEMEAILDEIQNAGIPVSVLPGNHDIYCPFACSYLQSEPTPAEPVTKELFDRHMGRFGYNDAFAKAPDSFSYAVDAGERLWLLALDANTGQKNGELSPDTLLWAANLLRETEKRKINTITMTHQNVLAQSEYMRRGFLLTNAEDLKTLFTQSGVRLNLSGHTHLQHTSVSGTLTDICTESAAIYPLGYGVLEILEGTGECIYTKTALPVRQKEALQRLDETIVRMLGPEALSETIRPEDRSEMISFATVLARLDYSGLLADASKLLEKQGWSLWNRYGKSHPMYERLAAILIDHVPQDLKETVKRIGLETES